MRLRKVKGAKEALDNDNKYVIHNAEELKGHLKECFPNKNNPLHVEIGCGKGKFITEMAEQNLDINFIGIEKADSVLLRTLQLASQKDYPNLKLILFDAAFITNLFNDGEIDIIYLNFSDPWKKNKQAKRRLTAPSFLEDYNKVLASDGAIYQKTDNRHLFEFSLEMFNEAGYQLSNISLNLHEDDYPNVTTEFEDKWSSKGPIYRLEARKRK